MAAKKTNTTISKSRFDKIFAKDNYIHYGNLNQTLKNNYVDFDESPADVYERVDESTD